MTTKTKNWKIAFDTAHKYIDINGTSFQGLIDGIPFYELSNKFGLPHHNGWTEDKVQAQWTIEFTVPCEDEGERKVVATIYDWKNGENPLYITEWHIGGHSTEAVDLVKQMRAGDIKADKQ